MIRRTFLSILGCLLGIHTATLPAIFSEEISSLQPVTKVPETPFKAPKGSWTMVILPDTQFYSSRFPEVFERQIAWIAKHRKTHNILFVLHEGDITSTNHPRQWTRMAEAIATLERNKVPFALVAGNHDYGDGGKSNNRETYLNTYFSPKSYRHSQQVIYFEKDRLDNTIHLFDSPTGPQAVVALEFGPRNEVLDWANQFIAQHPERITHVLTHAYLSGGGIRNQWGDQAPAGSRGGNPKRYLSEFTDNVNDGEDMWNKFIRKHANVRFVYNGHITANGGKAYLISRNDAGKAVHQLMTNFQDNSPKSSGTTLPARGYGGGAYLRVMQFHPDAKTIVSKVYSPWYDHWLDQEYDRNIDLSAPAPQS